MSVPLPRTSSCGDTKTVEIIRLPKISVHHQAGEGLVSLQSPCASHVDGAEVSADEEGYLTMRNMQTLLTNSDGHACAAPQDYEQRVVRQQLPLSDAHEGFADGSPFGAYAEITSRQQPTFDEENEYVPMTEKNGQYAISNGSNSEDYETVRFVHEKPRSFKCEFSRYTLAFCGSYTACNSSISKIAVARRHYMAIAMLRVILCIYSFACMGVDSHVVMAVKHLLAEYKWTNFDLTPIKLAISLPHPSHVGVD